VFQFIEGDFEDYVFKLQDPQVTERRNTFAPRALVLTLSFLQQWVGEVEINALAVMYKYDFSSSMALKQEVTQTGL